ncbi:MAG TPA: hypothetical protein VKY32_07120 [Flavobacterium sp.]|nr:hypothetical protein [Flavobacterium sp.]
MSNLTDIVAELETKFERLLHDIKRLEGEKEALSKMLETEKQTNNILTEKQQTLTRQIESLKAANALLGSDEYKRETKLKINSLVREIDHCIAQLSD